MQNWFAYIIFAGDGFHYHIEAGVNQDLQAVKLESRKKFQSPKASTGLESDALHVHMLSGSLEIGGVAADTNTRQASLSMAASVTPNPKNGSGTMPLLGEGWHAPVVPSAPATISSSRRQQKGGRSGRAHRPQGADNRGLQLWLTPVLPSTQVIW